MDEQEPLRVLQIPGKMDFGGVSAVIMNYFRHMDKRYIQFDFAVNEDCTFPQEEELKESGSQVYRVSSLKYAVSYMCDIYKIIKYGKYHIVHAHMNTLNVFPLMAAWTAGAGIRICHNHSTDSSGELMRNIAKSILKRGSKIFPTHYAACSMYAAEWLYGKRFCRKQDIKIIRNGIELKRFYFDSAKRELMRRTLKIEGKYVVGHVGRFVYQKNHKLLIEIFEEIHKQREDAVLLLVGEGELKKTIFEQIKRKHLEDYVVFAGTMNDTSCAYNAMDVFVLPSRYEGLPVTIIEAQANGLLCVVSDAVPAEADWTGRVIYKESNASILEWADAIAHGRQRAYIDVDKKIYDIDYCAKELFTYYMKIRETL